MKSKMLTDTFDALSSKADAAQAAKAAGTARAKAFEKTVEDLCESTGLNDLLDAMKRLPKGSLDKRFNVIKCLSADEFAIHISYDDPQHELMDSVADRKRPSLCISGTAPDKISVVRYDQKTADGQHYLTTSYTSLEEAVTGQVSEFIAAVALDRVAALKEEVEHPHQPQPAPARRHFWNRR